MGLQSRPFLLIEYNSCIKLVFLDTNFLMNAFNEVETKKKNVLHYIRNTYGKCLFFKKNYHGKIIALDYFLFVC